MSDLQEEFSLDTPVVFITYIRLDTASQVFEMIRSVKPKKLYHVSDAGKNDEGKKKVQEVRDYINSHIDWPCEVHRNYAEENMGCRERIASGLTWAFSHEEKAIIVEDDVLPTKSFFLFCQEMLDKYENDDRIFAVAGARRECDYTFDTSYSFSMYSDIWGWATWRRAWQGYDVKVKNWPKFKKDKCLRKMFSTRSMLGIERELDMVYEGENDTWDFQWFFHRVYHNKLEVVPNISLTRNIGLLSEGATHPIYLDFELTSSEMDFPLIHPEEVVRNLEYDRTVMKNENAGWIETIVRLIVPAGLLKSLRLFLKKCKVIS